MDNLFAIAAIRKYRFPTSYMVLTVEQLFQLPLTSNHAASLEDAAQTVYREIQELGDVTFVSKKSDNRKRNDLNNKLEIIKQVIEYKEQLADDATKRAVRASQKQQLEEQLQQVRQNALSQLSEGELLKRLAELK